MAAPTNKTLVQTNTLFADMLSRPATGDMELWQVTTQIMVKKGTSVESIMANMVTGKAVGAADENVQGPIAVTDLTKLAG